ncbi:MAG: endosialidase [Clostridiales bacterium]|jgi:carbon monoxide dehydrogenase subunit G|nr:endosialidase [Clostridiales bacterium]
MPIVAEGISLNPDKTLNFGNHTAKEKVKVKDFDVDGRLYSVKTHNEVTRLEQDGKMLIECVPGASFFNFRVTETEAVCEASGAGVTNFTMELIPDAEYKVYVGGPVIGSMKAGMSGKISFSAELDEKPVKIEIKKL